MAFIFLAAVAGAMSLYFQRREITGALFFLALILASVGLILIFGMMGVINMAHGELMMIGAYITAFTYHAGVPAPLAILLAGIGAGIFGVVLERLIICHFYNQLLSSLVVTWGLSLMIRLPICMFL